MAGSDNPYLGILRQEQPQAENPYVDLLRTQTQDETNRVKQNLIEAQKTNPDAAAKSSALAQKTGLPPDVVERNFDTVAPLDQANTYVDLLTDSPTTKRFLTDPTNAKIASDDIENLTGVEKFMNDLFGTNLTSFSSGAEAAFGDNAGGLADFGRSLAASAPVFNEGVLGAVRRTNDVIGAVNPLNYVMELIDPGFRDRVQAKSDEAYNRDIAATRALADLIRPDLSEKRPVVQSILGGVESAGVSMLSFAASGGNPTAALAIMGEITGGTSYNQARDAGLDTASAAMFSFQQEAVEVLTEKIPVEGLFKGIKAGTPFFKLLGIQLITENVTEQVATAWQDYNEWAFLHPDKDFSEYIKERPDAAFETLVATTTATILQTSISRAAAAPFQRDAQKAVDAAQFLGGMDQAQAAAIASLTALRDPVRGSQVIGEMMSDRGAETIYIDAAALVDAVGNAEDTDATYAKMGFTSDQVAQAAMAGQRLPISSQGFAANILLDDKMYAALRDHVTPQPDGMTNFEATQWEKSGLQDEIERMGVDQPEITQPPGEFFAVNPNTGAQVWYNRAPTEEARPGNIRLNAVYQDKDGVFHTVTSAGDGSNRVVVSQGFNPEDPTNISVSEVSAPLTKKDAADMLNAVGAVRLERVSEPGPADPIETAVDTAVTLAENEMGYQGLFRTAKEAGMTDAQFQVYLANIAETKNRARKAEQKKAMRQELAKATDDRKAAREKVREEVAARVNQRPAYAALNAARQDRFDRGAMVDAIAGTINVAEETAALERVLPEQQTSLAQAEASAADLAVKVKDAKAQLASVEKEVSNWAKIAAKSTAVLERNRALVDKLDASQKAAVNASNTAIAEAERAIGRNIGKALNKAQALAVKADQAAIDLQEARAAMEISLAAAKSDQSYLADAREQAGVLRAVSKEIDTQAETASKAVENAKTKLKETTDTLKAIRSDVRKAAELKLEKLGLPKDTMRDGGVNPEIVAEALGFTDAFEIIIAMATAEPVNTVVDQETDAQMARDHGDILDAENALRSAIHALHNDSQADIIAMEYNQMREQAGLGRISAKLLRRAADTMIRRYQVKNITPSQFLMAERKWGREAARLLRKGDRAGAANAKFKQLLNFEMFRMASDVRQGISKDLKHFRKYSNDRAKFPSVDASFVDAIKTVLANYSLRPPMTDRAKQSLLAQMQAKADDTYGTTLAIPKKILHEENSTNYRELTYGNFSEVMDTVKTLEKQGRDAKTITRNGKQIAIDEAKAAMLEASSNIEPIARAKNQETRTSSNRLTEATSYKSWDDFNSSLDGIRQTLAQLDVLVLKPEFILQMMDNGEIAGPWFQTLMQPFVDAHASKSDLTRTLIAPIIKNLQNLPKITGEKLAARVNVPELNWKARRSEILMVALNTGNQSNLDKMVKSRPGWTLEGVQAAVDNLTVEEWNWVQSVWDTYETMWPFVESIARDELGRSPEKIEPIEFTTANGVKMKGGYIPMLYDYNAINSDIKTKGKDGGEVFNRHLRATVYNGMTEARVEDYSAPILLDAGALSNALGQVTHYITHYQAVKDSRKILNDPAIIKEVQTKLGPEYYDELVTWTDALANNNAAPPQEKSFRALNAFLNELRTNYTVATLGISWTTGASQLLGHFNTVESLGLNSDGTFSLTEGGKWWGVGVSKMFSIESVNQAFALSKELRFRVDNVDQAIAEARRNVSGKSSAYRHMQHAALGVIGRIQLHTVDVPTWIGAFNKGLSLGKSEIDATAYADSIVRTSQASGQLKDLSAFQRSNSALVKSAAMFMTYFTLLYNLQRRAAGDLTRAPSRKLLGGMTRFMLLLVLPALGGAYISGEPPEEDDSLLAWAGTHVASYGLTTFPLLGNMASSMIKGYDPRVTALEGLPHQLASALDGSLDILWGDGDAEDVADIFGGFGRLVGLPGASQAARFFNAIDQDGDVYDYFVGPRKD